ncbi:arrestin domain-containing protein 1a [Synchiropus splendidus]|uniref:arrestin domain-containing protein 1a n=1 Tax=Synchiropus splendidus TaxID=270530 RepID=UPI00237ED519|nr:arrestin domain-containing protein 1a [Synchiropus splendidus]
MGKIQKFTIAFDQSKDVYTPGESISGTVSIAAAQALVCKAIKVNCNGFCGITSKVNDTDWTVEEQYFNSTVSLADKGTLKEGEHTFPFKFLIPAAAPTSFEGKYGRIVYRVRAFIDTPRFAKDYSTEKPFYLLRLLNLNEVPDIWEASSSAVKQQFTYMLMKTGTVVLKAETDMKGYTPGQNIQVTAHVHNQSGKSTGNISASLVQRVTYETKKPTHDLRTIAEVQGGAVKGGKEVEWKDQIIVPSLPQSSQAGCDLIKIEYFVQVSLKSPDVLLTLPICIGNVSLDKKRKPSKPEAPASSSASAEAPAPDASATTPTLPPRPAPKPAPRPTPRSRTSSHISPSAPPVDYLPAAEGQTPAAEECPNKRQSQLVSPNAFSYAPGLFFPHGEQPNGPSASRRSAGANGSSGATSLYPALGSTPQPPNYETSPFPQEAPPSYDESCNT